MLNKREQNAPLAKCWLVKTSQETSFYFIFTNGAHKIFPLGGVPVVH